MDGDGETKKILGGRQGRRSTIYLDIRETTAGELNCRFRLLATGLNEVFFVFFCQNGFRI